MSVLLRQHAPSQSPASEGLTSSLPDNPLSFRPLFGIEMAFTVHSYPKFIHVIGNQESVSSTSASNTAELPYFSFAGISRTLTLDPYRYALILDNQIYFHPKQDLRCYNLPVNRINKSLQNSVVTRNCGVIRKTQNTTETKFEVTEKFIGLNPHPVSASNQIE